MSNSRVISETIRKKMEIAGIKDYRRIDFMCIAFLFYMIKKNGMSNFITNSLDEILQVIGNKNVETKLREIFSKVDLLEFSILYKENIEDLAEFIENEIEFDKVSYYKNDDGLKDVNDLLIELIEVKDGDKILLTRNNYYQLCKKLLLNKNISVYVSEIFDKTYDRFNEEDVCDDNMQIYIYYKIKEDLLGLIKNYNEIEEIGINKIIIDEKRYSEIASIDVISKIKLENKKIIRVIRTRYFNETFRLSETKNRKIMIDYLYENKIKTVINACDISSIIILETNPVHKIMMVDGTKEYVENNKRVSYVRNRVMSDKNIKNIIEATKKETAISKIVSIDVISQNESSINPSDYVKEEFNITNGVEIGPCIKDFIRGIVIPRNRLKGENDLEKIKLLTLDNIVDGEIVGEYEDMEMKIGECEKYLLKNKDMIIKKNGANIQIAIINMDSSQKVVPYGNMFVVRFDENKLNPYYVKNYLELNEIGIRQFENSKSDEGVITLRNLNKGKFYKIIIPKIDIEIQNKIEEDYLKNCKIVREKQKEIRELKESYRINFNNNIGGIRRV